MEIFQTIYTSQFNLCEARGTCVFSRRISDPRKKITNFLSYMSFIVLGAGAVCIKADTRIL